jgi:hypothetical protein
VVTVAYEKSTRCRRCDEPIRFALTEKGKRMPINPAKPEDEKNPIATYALYDDGNTGEDRVRYIGPSGHFDYDAEHPVVPHWATCVGHKLTAAERASAVEAASRVGVA